MQYDRSKNDPYCAVRKHLLKFQEEMSVVVVIWRDCQQLIENYCQEEVKVWNFQNVFVYEFCKNIVMRGHVIC